jgi:hypothetical protein
MNTVSLPAGVMWLGLCLFGGMRQSYRHCAVTLIVGILVAPAQTVAYLARRPTQTHVMGTRLRWRDGF